MLPKLGKSSTRFEHCETLQRIFAGQLSPVHIDRINPGESALIRKRVSVPLEPIAGDLITPITCELHAVLVPLQAMLEGQEPDEPYASTPEGTRERLMSGVPLFPMIHEGALSKAMGVIPRMVDGKPEVCASVVRAHNAAVNHLRLSRYYKATTVDPDNRLVTPAILSATILDRYNGVLVPEERINGAISLSGSLPIRGIGRRKVVVESDTPVSNTNIQVYESDGTQRRFDHAGGLPWSGDGDLLWWEANEDGLPSIFADMDGSTDIARADFYRAERIDALTRRAHQVLKSNPIHGEEVLSKWAHGLSLDDSRECVTLYSKTVPFGIERFSAFDAQGMQDQVRQSIGAVTFDLVLPVPRTEFGGQVVYFVSVKPVESLGATPHPFNSREWVGRNYLADEMEIDPVRVEMRDIDANVPQADENTTAMWLGPNHIYKNHEYFGLTRNTNPNSVESKNVMWTMEIPKSVDEGNVIYPDELESYPFAIQDAEVASVIVASSSTISTPIRFGPTPLEEVDHLDDENLFEDQNDE